MASILFKYLQLIFSISGIGSGHYASSKECFSKPIICNINSGKYSSSMMCGARFEGKERGLLVEKLEDLASKFGFLMDESVQKKKEEIQSRKNEE